MMQKTAAALAPWEMPIISGLAKGLRSRVWKMIPDMAKDMPVSTASVARGRRTLRTIKSTPLSTWPVKGESSERTTSPGGTG
ncbi:hypothetical protein D3C86_2151920 [compost metagenome]